MRRSVSYLFPALLRCTIMTLEAMHQAMENELTSQGAPGEKVAAYDAAWKHATATPGRDKPLPCPLCFMQGEISVLSLLPDDGDHAQATCATCGEFFYWPRTRPMGFMQLTF